MDKDERPPNEQLVLMVVSILRLILDGAKGVVFFFLFVFVIGFFGQLLSG